jgi:hypothetical protein
MVSILVRVQFASTDRNRDIKRDILYPKHMQQQYLSCALMYRPVRTIIRWPYCWERDVLKAVLGHVNKDRSSERDLSVKDDLQVCDYACLAAKLAKVVSIRHANTAVPLASL